MKNKHFNETTFQYAVDLLERDPFHATEKFKEYTEQYPTDYYARAFYALSLTRINMFEEAEKEYEDTLLESSSDNFYHTNYKNLRGFNYNMIIVKIKILAHQRKYQEILDLIDENMDMFAPNDIKYISYYCRIRLGIFNESFDTVSYRFLQTMNYSEDLFREHLKGHIKKYNKDLIDPNSNLFEDDFPIDKVLTEIKKYIPSDDYISPGYFENQYFFKYDYCGKVDDTWANLFTVVCYQGTSNIITMCPVVGYGGIPCTDLNYLKYEIEEPKVKRLSQIDKFNRRFKR